MDNDIDVDSTVDFYRQFFIHQDNSRCKIHTHIVLLIMSTWVIYLHFDLCSTRGEFYYKRIKTAGSGHRNMDYIAEWA